MLALVLFFEVLTRIRADYNNCEYIHDARVHQFIFVTPPDGSLRRFRANVTSRRETQHTGTALPGKGGNFHLILNIRERDA